VLPVVTSLLSAAELVSVDVRLGPPEDYNRTWTRYLTDDELASVWVIIDASDSETWFGPVWSPDTTAVANTLGEVAAVLADRLEDWVCETSFGWGQRRLADYVIPER
jgi:hypothetical protein